MVPEKKTVNAEVSQVFIGCQPYNNSVSMDRIYS